MTKARLLDIINEEIDNVKYGIDNFLIRKKSRKMMKKKFVK